MSDKKLTAEEIEAEKKALAPTAKFYDTLVELSGLATRFQRLFASVETTETPYTLKEFMAEFVGKEGSTEYFEVQESVMPTDIALVVFDEHFAKESEFEIIDPTKLPKFARIARQYKAPRVTHSTFKVANQTKTVPTSQELWLRHKPTGEHYIVGYEIGPQGDVELTVIGSYWEEIATSLFARSLSQMPMQSRYIQGQALEMTPGGIKFLDLSNAKKPTLDPALWNEIEKNILIYFKSADKLKAHNLPLRRGVLFESYPGCGKTMTFKYIAHELKGIATTIWVTSKAIMRPHDVSRIFTAAKTLAPTLLVFEDFDLISGSREIDRGILGELLNQLCGVDSDGHAIVTIASTNKPKVLDEALRDRPGRFDRTISFVRPTAALAREIALAYLIEHNVPEELARSLNLESVFSRDGVYTGAQIAFIADTAILEAVHRGCAINDMCLRQAALAIDPTQKPNS
jgi:hypothetical protein